MAVSWPCEKFSKLDEFKRSSKIDKRNKWLRV